MGNKAVIPSTELSLEEGEQILDAIIVVIANTNPTCPPGRSQAGLLGYVGERAIPIVVIETVAAARGNPFECSSSEDQRVHPPVVVIVEKRAPCTVHLDDVGIAIRVPVDHGVGESGGCRDINKG